MGALEMLWVWVYEYVLGPITFIATVPTSPLQIVSQSVTNNRCAPSCGGHKRKVRGHVKKFSAGASRLQIASDATVRKEGVHEIKNHA